MTAQATRNALYCARWTGWITAIFTSFWGVLFVWRNWSAAYKLDLKYGQFSLRFGDYFTILQQVQLCFRRCKTFQNLCDIAARKFCGIYAPKVRNHNWDCRNNRVKNRLWKRHVSVSIFIGSFPMETNCWNVAQITFFSSSMEDISFTVK